MVVNINADDDDDEAEPERTGPDSIRFDLVLVVTDRLSSCHVLFGFG